MILTGENRRTRRRTCPSGTLSTTNPTSIDPGANPGLRGERPATNDLNRGTALSIYLVRYPVKPPGILSDLHCFLSSSGRTATSTLQIAGVGPLGRDATNDSEHHTVFSWSSKEAGRMFTEAFVGLFITCKSRYNPEDQHR
jgi:hypothetical protein